MCISSQVHHPWLTAEWTHQSISSTAFSIPEHSPVGLSQNSWSFLSLFFSFPPLPRRQHFYFSHVSHTASTFPPASCHCLVQGLSPKLLPWPDWPPHFCLVVQPFLNTEFCFSFCRDCYHSPPFLPTPVCGGGVGLVLLWLYHLLNTSPGRQYQLQYQFHSLWAAVSEVWAKRHHTQNKEKLFLLLHCCFKSISGGSPVPCCMVTTEGTFPGKLFLFLRHGFM